MYLGSGVRVGAKPGIGIVPQAETQVKTKSKTDKNSIVDSFISVTIASLF
jgi:hypothetical protein